MLSFNRFTFFVFPYFVFVALCGVCLKSCADILSFSPEPSDVYLRGGLYGMLQEWPITLKHLSAVAYLRNTMYFLWSQYSLAWVA